MGKEKKKKKARTEIKSGRQYRAVKENIISHETGLTVTGYFLHSFCTKNKLMKSFKFTGISILSF